MGLFRKVVRGGIGIVGKHFMNHANALSLGLAGKAKNAIVNSLSDRAGLIGKRLHTYGHYVLPDGIRNITASTADQAIKYIPKGSVRDALTKINDAAQGRNIPKKEEPKVSKEPKDKDEPF